MRRKRHIRVGWETSGEALEALVNCVNGMSPSSPLQKGTSHERARESRLHDSTTIPGLEHTHNIRAAAQAKATPIILAVNVSPELSLS